MKSLSRCLNIDKLTVGMPNALAPSLAKKGVTKECVVFYDSMYRSTSGLRLSG